MLSQKYHLLSIPLDFKLDQFFLNLLGVLFGPDRRLSLIMPIPQDPFREVLIVELEVNKLLYFVLVY